MEGDQPVWIQNGHEYPFSPCEVDNPRFFWMECKPEDTSPCVGCGRAACPSCTKHRIAEDTGIKGSVAEYLKAEFGGRLGRVCTDCYNNATRF